MKNIILSLLLLWGTINCFSQVNLSDGLVAYYPFTGNANNIVSNTLHGTINGGIKLTQDRFGSPNRAYLFNGTNTNIIIKDNGLLSNPAFSLCYYFKSNSSNQQVIIGKIGFETGLAATFNAGVFHTTDRHFFGTMEPYANCTERVPLTYTFSLESPPVIKTNEWHCVVNTFEAGTERTYIDGIMIKEEHLPFNGAAYCTNTDLIIGSWWKEDPEWFNGIIDDVRIYNRAINEDEVRALCLNNVDSTVINDYAAVFDFDLCKNMLSVDDAKAFKTGDTVLLIQMKGAIIDSSDNPSFGQITDYNNSGNYEFNIVKSRVGNSIYLLNNLVRAYDFQHGKVQLVRVPYYQNIAFDNTLTSLAWDGNKGGILALNASGTLSLSADIDVTGKGFRSGTKLQNSRVTSNATGYFYNPESNNGGEKGEGISNISNDKKYGRGSLSNGGGGGNAHNAGGGGGANGGGGGKGGDQYEPLKSIVEKIGGKGGNALANNAVLNKLYMGGAGGMGQANDLAEFPAGNGGGIIIISANILQANGFSIKANGTNATEAPSPDAAKDGMAGGGGGGSISLAITSLVDNIKVETAGGKGADQTSTSFGGKAGGGGGGGGGVVALSQNTVPGQYSIDLSGGVSSVNTGYGDDAWGAEPGEDGVIITGVAFPIGVIFFKQGIDSVRFTEILINCHQLSFDGEVFGTSNNIFNWDWNFGDGTSGSMPNPVHDYSSEGTFNVRLVVTNSNACTDSIVKSIKVYSDKIDISNDTSICIHSSVQLTSSTGGQAYYWTPASDLDNPNITNPVTTPAATTKYFVSVVKAPGCIVSDSVLIKVNPLPVVNAARSNDITCSRPQSQLNTYGTAVNFSWTPVEDLNVSTMADPIASPKSTKTFTVVGTDMNGCKQSDSVKVIVDFSDKPFTGMANAFTPNHDGLNDCFGVSHLNITSDLEFRIYNRFGQLIFITDDPAKCWDGTFKGEPQNSGVYIYTVKGMGSCNLFNLKGKVVLIR